MRGRMLIMIGASIGACLSGCTTTTMEFENLPAGQEIALYIDSWRSPLTVVNHGPGEVAVNADAEGTKHDWIGTAAIGATRVPLHGPSWVTISNHAEDGPEAVALRVEIKDPAEFHLGQRPIADRE